MSIIEESQCCYKDLIRFDLERLKCLPEELSSTERKNLKVFQRYREQLNSKVIDNEQFIYKLKEKLTFDLLERLGILFTCFVWLFLKLFGEEPQNEDLYLLLIAERIHRKLHPTLQKLPIPLLEVDKILLKRFRLPTTNPNIHALFE